MGFGEREGLHVLGVLLATRLVLGVLLAHHGRRELRGNIEGAPHEVSRGVHAGEDVACVCGVHVHGRGA